MLTIQGQSSITNHTFGGQSVKNNNTKMLQQHMFNHELASNAGPASTAQNTTFYPAPSSAAQGVRTESLGTRQGGRGGQQPN